MKTYLEPTDPGAFVDHPRQDPQRAANILGATILCPRCQGYGGWNLQTNAYALHGREDTAENRHRFAHFRAHCVQCNGWGYVTKADADHVHQWVRVEAIGNCLHLERCAVCGREHQVDTSG